MGVCCYRPPALTHTSARLVPEQALAGDPLTLEVQIAVTPPAARVDVVATVTGPVEVVGHRAGRAAWTLSPGGPAVRVDLASSDWGRVAANAATIRADGPLGLVHRTWTVPLGAVARVLPRPEQLRSLLDPPPRAAAGTHASPARGGGLDFAELRPLVPGDRLSEVNWRASARRPLTEHSLLVNARHPERTGDVVLLLDTAADDVDERAPWLPRAARAAWALGQAHLRAHDRVGLVTFGGSTSWITAQGGERAAYALLDKLLAARSASGANRSLAWLPFRLLPTDAALVAVTPLHALHVVEALVDLRRRGRRRRRPRRRHDRPAPDRPGAGAGPAVLGAGAGSPRAGARSGRHRDDPVGAGRAPGPGRHAPRPRRPPTDGAHGRPPRLGQPMRAPWRAIRRRRYEPTASPLARSAVAAAALVVTSLLVVQAVDAWGSGGRLAAMIGAVAIAFQLLAVLRWPGTAGPAALLLGLLAGVAVLPTANRDLAVQMAVLFLAATELTGWAVRLRSVIPETAASLARQLGALGAVVAGGGLVAAALLAAGRTTSAPSGRTALLLGLAAAVVPVGLLASRWWRSAP